MSTTESQTNVPPLHNFVCFYRGKQISIQAETSYKAQQKAVIEFKAKKSFEVTVVYADKPIDKVSL